MRCIPLHLECLSNGVFQACWHVECDAGERVLVFDGHAAFCLDGQGHMHHREQITPEVAQKFAHAIQLGVCYEMRDELKPQGVRRMTELEYTTLLSSPFVATGGTA